MTNTTPTERSLTSDKSRLAEDIAPIANVRLSENERQALAAIIVNIRQPYRRDVTVSDAVRFAVLSTAATINAEADVTAA